MSCLIVRVGRLFMQVHRGMVPGIMLLLITTLCSGEPPGNDSPVDGALGGSLWYDEEAGNVLPVFVEPEVDDSLNRDSRWLPKAKRIPKPEPTPSATAGGATGGAGVLGSDLTIGNLLGWFLLLVIVGAAVSAIIFAISKTEVDLSANARLKATTESGTPDEQTIERMKHLPAELRRTDVNLRSEAERLMNDGEYDQAVILLFGHQLLLLDHVGMLRLNRGKTNRRYVRETRAANEPSAQVLLATVIAFEKSYFGRHSISRDEFTQLWQSNEQLEQAVELRRESAA